MTTFRESTDEEIAAICSMRNDGAPLVAIATRFGRGLGAITHVLREAGRGSGTESDPASGIDNEAFGTAMDWIRRDREAKACARHLADLQRVYPNGPPWGAA